jgi:hypothetical protein
MTQVAIQQALELAIQHHQAGRLPEAGRLYPQILTLQTTKPKFIGSEPGPSRLASAWLRLNDPRGGGGVTLVPLAIYFKVGRPKLELGVGRGKRQHDKRESIRKKEMDREVRRAMTHRQ